jgi:hypothetical protein
LEKALARAANASNQTITTKFTPEMKRIFILSVLISLGMICSCQKQDSAAEQQLTQRKADAREQAFDERVNGLEERVNELDKRVSALAEIRNAGATAPAAQSQVVIRDPAQVQAEVNSGIEQAPSDAQARIADPLQGDPEKAEKDRMREQLAQSQRGLEDQQSRRQRKLEQIQKWRMSGAAASTPAQATSSIPSPAVETTSPTPP